MMRWHHSQGAEAGRRGRAMGLLKVQVDSTKPEGQPHDKMSASPQCHMMQVGAFVNNAQFKDNNIKGSDCKCRAG